MLVPYQTSFNVISSGSTTIMSSSRSPGYKVVAGKHVCRGRSHEVHLDAPIKASGRGKASTKLAAEMRAAQECHALTRQATSPGDHFTCPSRRIPITTLRRNNNILPDLDSHCKAATGPPTALRRRRNEAPVYRLSITANSRRE